MGREPYELTEQEKKEVEENCKVAAAAVFDPIDDICQLEQDALILAIVRAVEASSNAEDVYNQEVKARHPEADYISGPYIDHVACAASMLYRETFAAYGEESPIGGVDIQSAGGSVYVAFGYALMLLEAQANLTALIDFSDDSPLNCSSASEVAELLRRRIDASMKEAEESKAEAEQ